MHRLSGTRKRKTYSLWVSLTEQPPGSSNDVTDDDILIRPGDEVLCPSRRVLASTRAHE